MNLKNVSVIENSIKEISILFPLHNKVNEGTKLKLKSLNILLVLFITSLFLLLLSFLSKLIIFISSSCLNNFVLGGLSIEYKNDKRYIRSSS